MSRPAARIAAARSIRCVSVLIVGAMCTTLHPDSMLGKTDLHIHAHGGAVSAYRGAQPVCIVTHSAKRGSRPYAVNMTTGNDLRQARTRLRLTQRELANIAGVSLRSINTWEALGDNDIPSNAEGKLFTVVDLVEPVPPPAIFTLRDVSDLELIAELARRLGERHPNGGMAHGDR